MGCCPSQGFSKEHSLPPSWTCTPFTWRPGRNSSATTKHILTWEHTRNILPGWLTRQDWELYVFCIQSLLEGTVHLGGLAPGFVKPPKKLLCDAAVLPFCFSSQLCPDYWFLQWLQSVIMRKQERNHPSRHKPTIRYYLGLSADLISTDPVVWVG